MHIHCTSSVLSRRQFLQWLMVLGGCSLVASKWTSSTWAAEDADHRASWREPIWVLTLDSGKIRGPACFSIPVGLPGSVMKLVAAMALLEDRHLLPEDALACRGTLHIQGQTFHCQHAHGKLAMREAIGLSCNLFFAQAARQLSVRRFLQAARQFRLHQPVGVGEQVIFPNEAEIGLPSQSYVLGLNRNLRPSALQLARMAGLIAQRGIPHLRPQTWDMLQGGMQLAVRHGTASELDPANHWRMAAKTGTTEHGHAFQSWLMGYFPIENPRYAFCLRAPVGTARENAVPLARRFFLKQPWLSTDG